MNETPHRRIKLAVTIAALSYLVLLVPALIWLHLSPHVVLALTIGGVLLLLLMTNPLFAVHGFVALLYVENVAATPDGLTAMKAMGPILLLGWLMSLAVRRKAPLRVDGLVAAILAYVCWCGISILYAINSEVALARLFTLVQVAAAALMFSSVVDNARKMEGILRAIVVWTCLTTLFGLTMYFLGLKPYVTGPGENRNTFAMYINIAVICACLLHQLTGSRVAKTVLIAGAVPLLLIGQALTFSRAGLIALLLALLALWARLAAERRTVTIAGLAAVLCAVALFLPGAFWARAASIFPSVEGRLDTFGMRVSFWEVGMKMIQDHPLTGVGFGNYVVAFPRYARGEIVHVRTVAHNSYISAASETGLVGLALFLLVHIGAFRLIHRAMRMSSSLQWRRERLLAIASEVSLIIIMVTALSGSVETVKYLWFFFGLAISLGRMASSMKATVPSADRGREAVLPARAGPA